MMQTYKMQGMQEQIKPTSFIKKEITFYAEIITKEQQRQWKK